MQEHEIEVIELKNAVVQRTQVFGIARSEIPATVHTAAIPCNTIYLTDNQPMMIGYESAQERDTEYNLVAEKLKKGKW